MGKTRGICNSNKRVDAWATFARGQCAIPSKGREGPGTAAIDSKRYNVEV